MSGLGQGRRWEDDRNVGWQRFQNIDLTIMEYPVIREVAGVHADLRERT